MATRRRVGVYIPNGGAYFRRVFEGIAAYCRQRHGWMFIEWPGIGVPADQELQRLLQKQAPDGAIGMSWAFWESLPPSARFPAVNIEYYHAPPPSLPRVGLDEVAIGRLASEHFRERGLRHLAAVVQADSLPSLERTAAFVHAASKWCPEPVRHLEYDMRGVDESLSWVESLPRPAGVFCWADEAAKSIHQACELLGRVIPDDVALLGVDNDEALCSTFAPALSSIDPNAQQVGYEAAALLDRLMDGEPAPAEPILVPPIAAVTRASTDTVATNSPDVAEAVRFIRANIGHSICVQDVVEHLAVSRSHLEKQFQRALGRTPGSEITRLLVQRGRDLLANTDLSIHNVAARCGYPNANHFTVMFRKQTGQTPSAYRRQTRLI